jgi:glutathione S-transferase
MKFYNSIGPNPRVVKMFMAEKGIDIPRVEVNLMAGENRQDSHLARNPQGQTPTLELDNGVFLAEILPICEYLEEIHPNPPLIGATPEERAVTRMWARRTDLAIIEPLTNGFRFSQGLALFENRVHCIPQAADDLKAIAREKLAMLEGLIEGRKYLAGDRFTLADIHLWVFLDFAAQVGQALDPANKNLTAWMARVGERPSAAASAA